MNQTDFTSWASPLDVSRETYAKLKLYEDLLKRWQKVKNLVAPSTLTEIWERHFLDSLQLLLHSESSLWLDLGAGAGFPGLVLAVALSERPNARVVLVESDHRKCAFMREVARETGAPATIINDRIENVVDQFAGVEVVTARALTALPKLLNYCAPLLESGAIGLFLKGQDVASELTDDPIFSRVKLEFLPSRTDVRGKIVRVNWRPE